MLTRLARHVQDRGDDGFTLVEFLVAITLVGILGTVMLFATVSTHRVLRGDSDEASGLADMRPAAERLTRDIRQARGVTVNNADPSYNATKSQLTLWIDSNSDYIQQASETVSWRLTSAGSGHYNLVRSVKSGGSVIEARTLVSDVAFTYFRPNGTSTQNPDTTWTDIDDVQASMTYDPTLKLGVGLHTVVFEARLRNQA